MANTIMFDEGMQVLSRVGLPATCYFLLSTRSVDATTPFAVTDTLSGGSIGEINAGGSAAGYTRGSQAAPTMSGHTDSFTQMTWTTGTATNWPATVRSIVMVTVGGTSTAGTAICAANLQSGGAARDMSAANTTEKVTPTITFAAGN